MARTPRVSACEGGRARSAAGAGPRWGNVGVVGGAPWRGGDVVHRVRRRNTCPPRLAGQARRRKLMADPREQQVMETTLSGHGGDVVGGRERADQLPGHQVVGADKTDRCCDGKPMCLTAAAAARERLSSWDSGAGLVRARKDRPRIATATDHGKNKHVGGELSGPVHRRPKAAGGQAREDQTESRPPDSGRVTQRSNVGRTVCRCKTV